MPSTAIVQDSHRVVPRSGSTRPQQVPLVSCNSLLGSYLSSLRTTPLPSGSISHDRAFGLPPPPRELRHLLPLLPVGIGAATSRRWTCRRTVRHLLPLRACRPVGPPRPAGHAGERWATRCCCGVQEWRGTRLGWSCWRAPRHSLLLRRAGAERHQTGRVLLESAAPLVAVAALVDRNSPAPCPAGRFHCGSAQHRVQLPAGTATVPKA